ncbi:MAG: hypothetical protein ACRD01_03520 [Terriglobales bacterium]
MGTPGDGLRPKFAWRQGAPARPGERATGGFTHPSCLVWLAVALAAAALAAGCGAALPALPRLTLAPATATLQAGGGSQQFAVQVLNSSDTNVVWKVNGVLGGSVADGTISQTGLYQAPATVPTGPVAVEALSVANPNSSASAAITLTPPIGITLQPATATVSGGGSQQFAATVTNTTNTAVTWAVNGVAGGNDQAGHVSSGGDYQAPASFPGLSTVTITVTSAADPNISAAATVTLQQAVAITVAPATATVVTGTGAGFVANVSGTTSNAVTWAVNGTAGGNPTVGTITATGAYLAPKAVPAPPTVTVSATLTADPTKSASAVVTIVAPTTVTVAPATANLNLNDTQQFTAQVIGPQNTAVTWSVNGAAGGAAAVGTISTSGLYTAPASYPGEQTITVTATSTADPTASGSAAVSIVQPVTVKVTPAAATVNLKASQAFLATVSGSPNPNVTWSVNGVPGGNATFGTVDANGLFSAPATLPSPATETVTATADANKAASASAQVTLQTPPSAFTIAPTSAAMTLAKAASGTQTFQIALSTGFTNPVKLTLSGEPVNVTAGLDQTTLNASGPVTLTLTTASISLAQTGVPVTLTATSTDAQGNATVQTATVLLSITGWAGHVSTLAGGPGGVGFEDGLGADDELEPTAITSDGGATLFFADKRGTALRSYGLVNQNVTTLLGGPYSYTIGEGDGIAYDPASTTVYVADGLRNRIVAFTLGTYTDRVVAGGGIGAGGGSLAGYADATGAAALFDYPHGIALSPDGSTLYVADSSNGVIRQVNVASGAVSTLAGQHGVYRSTDGIGAAASFCQPTGLAIAPGGANLYISDQCGYVIRQLALATATVSTVAGNGTQGQSDGPAASATFNALAGVATDPHAGSNLVYIVDGDEIRALHLGSSPTVYTLAGDIGAGQNDGASGGASFYDPSSVTALADNVGPGTTTLFVADSDNGLLRRLDFQNPLAATSAATAQATVTTIAGQPSHRGSTDGVGTGAHFSGASVATFSQPEGIVTDGTTAYVADSENGAIRKIDLATGQVSTVAGPHLGSSDGLGPEASFYKPGGLAWDQANNILYIADTGNAEIRKLDLATDIVSTIAGSHAQAAYVNGTFAAARFNHPYGILVSPDGTKLYVADTGNDAIRLIDLSAGTVSTLAGGDAPNGGLGSADGVGNAARFAEPNGLVFDATGQNIYISDFENEAIRELNLSTLAVTTVVGFQHLCGFADGSAATATLCTPAFIATDGRSLFWGDSNTGLLRVLDFATNQVSTLAGSPGLMHMVDGDFTEAPGELIGPVRYNGVFGLALAPDDSFILFTDKTANVIRIIH